MASLRVAAGAAAAAAGSGDHLRVDWTQNVYARSQAMGVEIHLPRYQPRSTLPLAACLWAGEQGGLRAFKHALYEAFFCEGEDIAADAEIRRAAERADLDPDGAIAAAYDSERFARIRAIRAEAEARGRQGRSGAGSTADGTHHWGMGGITRLLAGEALVPRTGGEGFPSPPRARRAKQALSGPSALTAQSPDDRCGDSV